MAAVWTRFLPLISRSGTWGVCTNTCTRGEGSTTNSGAEHTSTHLAEHELSAVAERLHILRRPQEHVVPAIRPHHNRQRQADDSGTALHE